MSDWEQSTRTDYTSKGFLARSGYGARPALLVVDFIKGFTDPNTGLGGDYSDELAVTAELLEAFRALRAKTLLDVRAHGPRFPDLSTAPQRQGQGQGQNRQGQGQGQGRGQERTARAFGGRRLRRGLAW